MTTRYFHEPVATVINLRPRQVDPGTRPALFDWSAEGTTVPLCLSPFEWQYLTATLKASPYAAAHELAAAVESQARQHLGVDSHPSNTHTKDTQ